jgi:hypothetical protein
MKNIKPINIWHNGQTKSANKLNAYIVHDNLENSCTFYYDLVNHTETQNPEETNNTVLANGNVNMTGEQYENWDGTNMTAYEFIAEQINVELEN